MQENTDDAAALVALVYRQTGLSPKEIFRNVSMHDTHRLDLVDDEDTVMAFIPDDLRREMGELRAIYAPYEKMSDRNRRIYNGFFAKEVMKFVRQGRLKELPKEANSEQMVGTENLINLFQDEFHIGRAAAQEISNLNNLRAEDRGVVYDILKILTEELRERGNKINPRDSIGITPSNPNF